MIIYRNLDAHRCVVSVCFSGWRRSYFKYLKLCVHGVVPASRQWQGRER